MIEHIRCTPCSPKVGNKVAYCLIVLSALGLGGWIGCKRSQEPLQPSVTAPTGKLVTDHSLLQWIEQNPGMETLDLLGSEVSDAGLRHLSRLGSLRELDLRACENVTDAGIQNLSQIPTLKTLSVSGCGISESGYRFLANLPGLEEIKVSGGVFERHGMGFLKGSPTIREIDLTPIHVNPDDLMHLDGYPSLKRLRIGSVKQSSDTSIASLHHLGTVKSLEYLDLTGCGLNDDAVEFLKDLPNLETLILKDNAFSARVLGFLPDAKKLKELDISENEISAPIEGIARLSSLRRLDLSWNFGIVDSELESLRPLTALEELNLKRTSITGSGLQYVPNLKSLDASFAALTDEGITGLKGLQKLEKVLIDGNHGLTDTGVAILGSLPKLTTLRAHGLKATGDCLRQFLPDSELAELSIAGWDLNEESVIQLLNLQNLTSLNLAGSRLTDNGLALVARLPRLRQLDVSGTSVTDKGLVALSTSVTLETLCLSDTKITGTGLVWLASLPALHDLDVSFNRLGDGMEEIAFPKSLTFLNLQATTISDNQLEAVSKIEGLIELNLVQTKVSDSGMARLAGLTNLERVFLDRTGVTIVGIETLLGIKSVRDVKNSIFSSFTDSQIANLRARAPFACFQELYLLPPGF
jgi:Leucine-rich repeat (LRR) protein